MLVALGGGAHVRAIGTRLAARLRAGAPDAAIDLAADLGVDMVKVFAAWPGLVNDEEAVAMYASYERGSHFKRPAIIR